MSQRTAVEFEIALAAFVAGCERITKESHAKNDFDASGLTFSVERGQKNVRVVRADPHRSVHCFVEIATGDVLKAAGWKAPAKGVRGNIYDDKGGLGRMGAYGPEYNR
jgi:hypothetical protein